MQWAIEVEGLHKSFKVAKRRPGWGSAMRSLLRPDAQAVFAVRDISFRIEPGERVAFIGHNGAGKSTTLKMLTGILHPTSGRASVCGYVPWQQRTRLAYHIGAVFGQRSQLYYHLPATETFALLAKIYDQDPALHRQRCDALVEVFDLGSFVDTPVHKLSLGQRMRCEIAASLLHAPEVLFLDEPTIGLDVSAKAAIRDVLKSQAEHDGRTVVLTSHDTGDMERVCERVILIHAGQVIRDQPLSELRRGYMHRKRVVVHSVEDSLHLDLPGTTVQRVAPGHHALEVDTTRVALDATLHALLSCAQVVDLAISDPPLEEVISAIYRDAGTGAALPSQELAL